ncbi:MAG: SUMF1/EgtB/PvdO family nonheme iron enzyme [Pirellulales bacterium]
MPTLVRGRQAVYSRRRSRLFVVAGLLVGCAVAAGWTTRTIAADKNPDANATTEAEMKPYTQKIPGTGVSFDMVPIPGGEYVRGSSKDEAERGDDEGPQHTVHVDPFWIETHEVTWDEYDVWSFMLDIQRRKVTGESPSERDKVADALTRPTKPYVDMSFGMGRDGYPAICMTQWAAKKYCEWLSAQDRSLLPPADRGRMGVRLSRRYHDGLFMGRRSR